FYLEKYEPSVAYTWKKSPTWSRPWAKGLPYLDGFDRPIIKEPAQLDAQFRAKNIWDYRPPTAGDIIDYANNIQGLNVYQLPIEPDIREIGFGSRPDSPFKDIRVRQAFSRALDRPLFAEAVAGLSDYKKAGIPYPTTLASIV